jgi:glycosyltransferase involved in cell wall biosynthesis
LANSIQAITNTRVRRSIKRADLLLAASGNTQRAIKKFYNKKSIILNETGCHISNNISPTSINNNREFNIVWVGRFIPTKLLNLALDVIKKVEHLEKLKFHIVGAGINDSVTNSYKEYAKKIGIENICVWYGNVPRDEVDKIMNSSDLFFFTSIVEATSTVVMEAIANNLPILCFDSCGHGEIVTENIGRKIPITNPKQSREAFAKEIENLFSNRLLLQQMSENCNSRIIDLSWQTKGERMYQLYRDILNQRTISNQ